MSHAPPSGMVCGMHADCAPPQLGMTWSQEPVSVSLQTYPGAHAFDAGIAVPGIEHRLVLVWTVAQTLLQPPETHAIALSH
jgi:hypothetical protein